MKKSIFLILVLIAAAAGMVSAVSAQDIDVDNMSNEQLILLLQSIMQKLSEDETAEQIEETPVPTEVIELMPEITPEALMEAAHFQIYDNKKLILERIPDDRFIPKDTGKDDNPDKDKKKPGPTPDPHGCSPDCPWQCWTEHRRQVCDCVCG